MKAKKQKAKIEKPKLDKNRILIADDEKEIRDLFRTVVALGLPHCRVDIAVNGAEVIDAFRDGRHGVILMDVRMPKKDGLAAFQELQDLCRTEGSEMPSVVFWTGYTVPDELTQAIAQSPQACLLKKPVPPADLVAMLKSKLGS